MQSHWSAQSLHVEFKKCDILALKVIHPDYETWHHRLEGYISNPVKTVGEIQQCYPELMAKQKEKNRNKHQWRDEM